jgi:Glutamine synthetase, catalytic domain
MDAYLQDKDHYDPPKEELKEIPTVYGSLREALESLDKDRAFLKAGGVFDDDFIDSYIELKSDRGGRALRDDPARCRVRHVLFGLIGPPPGLLGNGNAARLACWAIGGSCRWSSSDEYTLLGGNVVHTPTEPEFLGILAGAAGSSDRGWQPKLQYGSLEDMSRK